MFWHLLTAILSVISLVSCQYEPNWDSLDKRPLPAWYDEAKIGIFLHWGVFSVPSFGSEWFWRYWRDGNPAEVNFVKQNYRPDWTYADFAREFTAEFYNPDHWADVFEAAGAKYVVLTTKHHEGFCNWPTEVSFNWNAMAVGPKRDLVGDLATAVRKKSDIHFGVYHSLFEWYNPVYLKDRKNQYKTQDFVRYKSMPELYELVNMYKPDVIWSDGDVGSSDYWNSTHFLAWLYNDSPVKDTVVTNDRWGTGTACKHGDFYSCHDRYNPGHKVNHKWENAMTIDGGSWGYRRNVQLSNYLSAKQLVDILAETVSCGGNLLMNIGPTKEGTIVPIFEERLRQFGSWLKVNGESIYATRPWLHQNDTVTKGIWYTSKKSASGTAVYAIVLQWPDSTLLLGAPRPTTATKVSLLGYQGEEITWSQPSSSGGMIVHVPAIQFNQMPCQWAWVFKLTELQS